MKNIKGILLSAGESKRMGELKALLDLNGERIINKLLNEYLESFLAELVLVLGYKASNIKQAIEVESDKLKIVVNDEYKKEMFSSIQRGISAISEADAILIGLIDHPFIDKKIINTLILNYKEEEILIPAFNGQKGHPIIIPFSLKKEILSLDSSNHSLRDITHTHKDKVRILEMQTDKILFDMDTREDYERAQKYGENKN